MIVNDIINYLEELAPLSYAEDFDNVGLLVGNKNNEVTGILVTLDTLESVIDEAIEKRCNLIVSFHPIIFKGLKKVNGNNYVEQVVIKAIQNNINIFAIHTALDNAFQGVNSIICDTLGLKNKKILLPQKGTIKKLTTYVASKDADHLRKALFNAGAGNIGMGMVGELEKETNALEFLQFVKNKMNASCIKHSELIKKPIKKVAVLGGSGSFAIQAAKSANADVLITSDLKYHDFFTAEKQIILADIGHYESERFTKNFLADYLSKKFTNFAVVLSTTNTNPVKYL